jgi:endo-1,4-beta-xylanase
MIISRRNFLASASAAVFLSQLKANAVTEALKRTGLKEAYQNDFYVGAAVGAQVLSEKNEKAIAILKREFNSITAENSMKWDLIRPGNKEWNWVNADQFVDFGVANNMYIVGHCLVWHSQVPEAIFKKPDGSFVSAKQLTKTMKQHIEKVVSRYKDRIPAWDVVNEAVDDDGTRRKSHWHNIMGEDFIAQAFHFAHDVDPKAHLMYNDYNTFNEIKRPAILEMVKKYKKQGVPIHGVGMQDHLSIDGPDVKEIEKAILGFAELGLRVHVTELDVDVLPSVWNLPVAEISTRFEYKPERDPYIKAFPKEMEEKLAKRYEDIFKMYLKHQDKIDRVTFWGIADNSTWLNDFPINGRTNYPLLFDRNLEPKPAYFRVLDAKKS